MKTKCDQCHIVEICHFFSINVHGFSLCKDCMIGAIYEIEDQIEEISEESFDFEE